MGDNGALLVQELNNIWNSVKQEKQLPKSSLDIVSVSKISTIFSNCLREKSLCPLESTTLVSDEIKQQLSAFLDGRLEKETRTEIDWKLNVVVANQHMQKSLQVVTEITIHGQKLEFDLEQFGKFRQELARSMLALEKYHT